MNEITRVALENEMDLILAHKQSMRLCELAGLSLPAQTTFATAVSEVLRSAIGDKNDAVLSLAVSGKTEKIKFIIAILEDKRKGYTHLKDEGYNYASKLVTNIQSTSSANTNITELRYRLPIGYRIDDQLVEKWRISMNTDPAVSPYEEIKRKNKQLIEMADKLRESEQQYISLTNSLPLMIFSLTPADGNITYANQWLQEYTGQTIEELNESKWRDVVHPDDFNDIWQNWQKISTDSSAVITPERRFKDSRTGEYRWHTGISTAVLNDDGSIQRWNTYMVDIHAQKMVEQALKDNQALKQVTAQLEEKVLLLHQSNEQLEQFAYIASHDLQEPLRKISFYSDFLQKKHGHHLPQEAQLFFGNLINATERMRVLIQDVLAYSTVRKDGFTTVNLAEITEEILQDLEIGIKEKEAEIIVNPLPAIEGNVRQLKQVVENLVSNSLKFSRPGVPPRIEITAETDNKNVILAFKDNGIGFDQQYMNKMFDLFKRLHSREKYMGTGIGLAICKKITTMHGGDITAVANSENGATFLVTLPLIQAQSREN